jgi:hypothetical protein
VEHVLAALVADPRGGAFQVLAALGVTRDQVERELRSRRQRVGGREQSRLKRKEQAMPEKKQREELTDEEVEAQIGAALPDREVMSILPIPDPTGGVPLPLPHYDPGTDDPGPDPQPEEGKDVTP